MLINLINAIHFFSKDEIFALAHLYESMLKEMRDAAGDSGEFYTPRALVRLMVTLLLYAYSTGTYSSRRIAARQNVSPPTSTEFSLRSLRSFAASF